MKHPGYDTPEEIAAKAKAAADKAKLKAAQKADPMNCACPKTCSCNAQTANLAQISCDGEVDHFGDEEGKSEADETAGTITAKETKKKITEPVKVVVNGKSSEGEGSDRDRPLSSVMDAYAKEKKA